MNATIVCLCHCSQIICTKGWDMKIFTGFILFLSLLQVTGWHKFLLAINVEELKNNLYPVLFHEMLPHKTFHVFWSLLLTICKLTSCTFCRIDILEMFARVLKYCFLYRNLTDPCCFLHIKNHSSQVSQHLLRLCKKCINALKYFRESEKIPKGTKAKQFWWFQELFISKLLFLFF